MSLGIEPGDEITFEPFATGYKIRKQAPTTDEGEGPFDKCRGSAMRNESMGDRVCRLRREYPRSTGLEITRRMRRDHGDRYERLDGTIIRR